MTRKQLAVVVGFIGVLVIGSLLVWSPEQVPELTPQPVEEQAAGIVLPRSVTAKWGETIWIEGECYPEDWQGRVDFELRLGDEVLKSEVVSTDCQIVCQGGQGDCGSPVWPAWDLAGLKPGIYQVWYRGRWVNLVDGREVMANPPSLEALEDGRHFVPMRELCVHGCYLPLIVR